MAFGMVSSIITIYSYVNGKVNGAKATTDDIMAALNGEFDNTKNQLRRIENQLGNIEIQLYRGFELAVYAAKNDMQFPNNIEIAERAINLYTQMQDILKGLNGINIIGGDILTVMKDQFEVSFKDRLN